jgi:citronellyl-CoA dehydrogenase
MARFSQEHDMFRRSVRDFIDREISPFVEDWETNHCFPARQLYKKIGDSGFLGLTYPEEYGGLGLDYWYKVILAEELGRIEAGGVAMSILAQTDTCTPALELYGSHELKKKFLEPAITGAMIGAIAITEPHAGSDISAISTVARDSGGSYIISGKKSYITNGAIADFVVTLCRTSGEAGARGMSLIVVPTDSPGFSISKDYKKLGNHCCNHAELTYESVRVPRKNVIGAEGGGYDIQMEQFQFERLILAVLSCAQGRRILNRTKAYVKERVVFNRPLIEHQSLAFSLVKMEMEQEFLQQMTYYCAELFMSRKECTRETAMVKLKASGLLRQVADACLQMYGGYGYMEDPVMSRAFRDARSASIAGGTDEAMQRILTKFL